MSNTHGELQLRRLMSELRFHPSLKYYDEINEIGDRLNQTYPHWQRNWTRIQFTDQATRSSLFIEHNRIGSQMDTPDSFSDFKKRILDGVKGYNERVPIEGIRRCGIRGIWLCPVEFDFDELLAIIQDKFYAAKEKLNEVIGTEFTDVAYIFVFEKAGYNVHLQMGPVKKDEIPRRIPPGSLAEEESVSQKNIDSHVGLGQEEPSQAIEPSELSESVTKLKYPDVAVFYDVDCYTEELRVNDIEIFLDKGYNTAKSVANGITKYLLEV